MAVPREKRFGLALVAVGMATVVLAALLFGFTTASGALDWVSVVTAVAGLLLAVEGFNMTFHAPVHH